ncbi:hypothetical protein GYMLUDRAFT_250957 [Collybiopsis luxurians FD-317 M1]|uniref:HNH nuclease domain-containing protein n=1 Tax=Collybiopsis luxurians FD-317 M1 TaxID=944289 RepID=A0A0D0C4C8_9AGAR|nr:hypothetical protein GYMLUDRAFT_250957 [Collybiopsis luxurians FD-317 M1]
MTQIDGLVPGELAPSGNILRFFFTPDHRSVYDQVYQAATNERDETKLRNLQVLGFLILFVPRPDSEALPEIVSAVRSTASEDLHVLGKVYLDCFIRPFYKLRGPRTPFSPDHSSRPSFNARVLQIKATLAEAPMNHSDAKDKALSLLDAEQIDTYGTGTTRCAHIVPDSTVFSMPEGPDKKYSASILAVFDRFGIKIDSLNRDKMHSLENVMTLALQIYDTFDRLELWLEATDNEHEYIVKAINENDFLLRTTVHGPIKLTSSDPNVPLPNPQFLEFHAAACKIAHLSGIAEHIENVLRDYERIGVLAEDGGSIAVLEQALFQAGLV